MGFEYLNIKNLPLPDSGKVHIKQAKLLGSVQLLGRTPEGRAMGRGKLCSGFPWVLGTLQLCLLTHRNFMQFPPFSTAILATIRWSQHSVKQPRVYLLLWISECFKMKHTANQN